MPYDPTDSDANVESSLGVGQVDSTTKALHEQLPNWLADGYGIRGPQRQRTEEQQAPKEPMNFGSKTAVVQPETGGGEQCTPPGGNTAKTYVKASHFVSGQWKCFWIETGDCPPP